MPNKKRCPIEDKKIIHMFAENGDMAKIAANRGVCVGTVGRIISDHFSKVEKQRKTKIEQCEGLEIRLWALYAIPKEERTEQQNKKIAEYEPQYVRFNALSNN